MCERERESERELRTLHNIITGVEVKTTHEKLTPLHLAARYIPRIQDRDAERYERSDAEAEVTSLSTSCKAIKLLLR